jgi:initiation factor 1A
MSSRNVRGGKAFKKGKKGGGAAAGGDDERAHRFNGRDEDQDYARIVRLLGDRRALCFCNDGYERVGKIRGGICRGPRKQIIRVGDIVLISFREFQEGGAIGAGGAAAADAATGKALTTDSGHKEIVDIMFRYEPRDLRHIRKETGIHPALLGAMPTEGGGATDDIFFDGDEPATAAAAAKKADTDDDDDLDIDAI